MVDAFYFQLLYFILLVDNVLFWLDDNLFYCVLLMTTYFDFILVFKFVFIFALLDDDDGKCRLYEVYECFNLLMLASLPII